MLRVEGILLGQFDTVALDLVDNANMLAVSVDDFHVFADSLSDALLIAGFIHAN
jgi:hypothetical protein